MSERIYKLQPNRTLALRGFDGLGASAALHSATTNSFIVSGHFQDPADFAVLTLWDADNFYEHPRLKYLPDFNFDGLTLSFDVRYTGLMPLDSPKYPTIDWPYLSAIRADGTTARIRLSDYATAGSRTPATATFTIEATGAQAYDRLTLWYENLAFDYIAPTAPSAATVAQALAAAINGTNWNAAGSVIPISASAAGPTLTVTAAVGGIDGNMLAMYATWKNERLRTSSPVASFAGGASDHTWHVNLDFAALGLKSIRLMWLTFAPELAPARAFTSLDWEARFSNWNLSGPEEKRRLKVAGPNSVRVEENDSWCNWTGTWEPEQGFYSGGYARKATSANCRVRVKYACAIAHDLYLGTALFTGAGSVTPTLDGAPLPTLACALTSDAPVNTRRLLKTNVPAGEHVVELTAFTGFRFDFLEAAVPSDIPEPLPVLRGVSPALDYSTDHTYKLPPARIHWIFEQLGFAAPMNEYIGVFWWNQRRRENARFGQVRVTFSGTFVDGDAVFLKFGQPGSTLTYGKSVFPADTPETIARHFAQFLNGSSVGVWATHTGNTLVITSRSPAAAYRMPFEAQFVPVNGSNGLLNVEGDLNDGDPGTWVVAPDITPAVNRGARDWHADMFAECARRNLEIVVAESMELVNPPAGFAAMFPDGKPVETDIGFGSLKSTHCSFGPAVRDYQKSVLTCIADLQSAAGLTPEIQLGEFLWWFFTNWRPTNPAGGMAYYDADTKAAAIAALGRPLGLLRTPDDDPLALNGGADARFLRARLHQHVVELTAAIKAACPTATVEVLFPYDVNYPKPAGIHQLGGRLNSYVNLPPEWHSPVTAGFDRIKTEALDFGAWTRDLNLSGEAIRLPAKLGWPRNAIRHLTPVFHPGYAWEKEVATGLAECSVVNLWAWDHICIFGYDLRPKSQTRSALQAA